MTTAARRHGLGLVQVNAALGRRNEAIKTYHRCVETMKAELDLAPPSKIVEAYLRVVQT